MYSSKEIIRNKIRRGIGIGIMALIFFPLFLAAVSWFTQYLWNWLVPGLFAGPVISFWQALGLLVLTKILLWPLGGKRWSHHKGQGQYWGARWQSMSPEARERLKARMREKWCPTEPEAPKAAPGGEAPGV